MLEANKSLWFEKIFTVYNRNLLKRRFHSLRVEGLEFLTNKDKSSPFIFYVNHSSWWDGLVMLEILKKFDFENYVMMEEKQLKRLFLFRKLGAFSIVRENPRQAVESINYAVNLLKKNSNRTLLIFPQGEILPNGIRPLRFYQGLARIIEKVGNCYTVPVALRYEFIGNFKPEIFAKINQPEKFETDKNFSAKSVTENLEGKLTRNLEELMQDILSLKTARYDIIF